VQQLGGSLPGKHSPSCIEFGKYEINSWYSSPFPRDLAKYVSICIYDYFKIDTALHLGLSLIFNFDLILRLNCSCDY